MRFVVLLAALAVSPAAVAQPGVSARTDHGVSSCCTSCGSGMCSADSTGAGGGGMTCCPGMHGAGAGHEGHGEAGAAGGMMGMHGAMHGAPYGAAETPAHAEVRAAINALFDAMRAGDGDALLAGFREGATLTSVGAGRDGQLRVTTEPISGFAEAVSAPHPEPYDERIGPIEVRVDGPLATAWMTYRFHVGETFSHCGVNAFQLANEGEGWKIIAVTDTRRTECAPAE